MTLTDASGSTVDLSGVETVMGSSGSDSITITDDTSAALDVALAMTRLWAVAALTRCSVAVAMTGLSAVAVQISLMVVTAMTYLSLMAR